MATDGFLLSQDLLERCAELAPTYDRENRFFSEDFEELTKTGYLLMAVPKEMGGNGMTLAEVARETRRLAYYAPATALATCPRFWTSPTRYRTGPSSLPGAARRRCCSGPARRSKTVTSWGAWPLPSPRSARTTHAPSFPQPPVTTTFIAEPLRAPAPPAQLTRASRGGWPASRHRRTRHARTASGGGLGGGRRGPLRLPTRAGSWSPKTLCSSSSS